MDAQREKGACIRIGGRALPLALNMAALERIDARFGSFEQMLGAMEETGAKDSGCLLEIAAILACGAQEMRDEAPDVTAEWLRRHARPGQLVALSRAVGEAISEGMRREEGDPGDDAPQDVVLEELEAKKNTAR